MLPRSLALGLMVVAVLSAPTPPARAAADGPDRFRVRGVTPDNVLNMRKDPSASAEQVGAIPHDGTGIENLGCVQVSGGRVLPDSDVPRGALWCRVRYSGIEGWASGRFLAEE